MFPWEAAKRAQAVAKPVIEKPKPKILGKIPAPVGKEYLNYQLEGIQFALEHPGTLIADEPGLGKTIQAIGVINGSNDINSVLIICPASLKLNWRNECDEWLTRFMSVAIFPQIGKITIINYDQLHKLPKELMFPDLLILDEAHYIKNEKTKRTVQVKVIAHTAKRTLLLTGTPILNRPKEIWTLLQIIDADTWDPATSYGGKTFKAGDGGNFFKFGKRYCGAFKQHVGNKPCSSQVSRSKCSGCHWDFSGASNLDELQEKLRASCMIRRLKEDVLTELPEKRRQIIELEAKEYGLPPEYDGIDDYDELVKKLRSNKLLFDQISSERKRQGILKVNDVIAHVEEALLSNEKLILFAHHKEVITLLAKGLHHHGLVQFTGDDSQEVKECSVDVFQDDPNCRIFLGSIMAAGVGITLHAASLVIFAEMDWVPGIMTQAEDRPHRIGQRNSVLIQHLVLNGSIDARMCKMLVKKQGVINAAIG